MKSTKRATFSAIIAQNRRKTNAVLATYVAIFIIIGLLVDMVRINANSLGSGLIALITFEKMPTVTLIMAFIALVIIWAMIANFKRIMLSGNDYKLLNPNVVLSRKERDLCDILDELLSESQTPFRPELYLMNAPYMNAFASGWNESNSLIALTTALIDRLNRDVANYAIFAFGRNNRNSRANAARAILLILQVILPLFTAFLQMYLSRSREYMADSGAAFIMNDGSPMIRALQKISGDYEKSDYSALDSNPTRRAAYIFDFKESFSTHPSIKNRIKALSGQMR